jgi:hypothetical protein
MRKEPQIVSIIVLDIAERCDEKEDCRKVI